MSIIIVKMNPLYFKFIQAIFMVLLMLQVDLVSAEEVRCIERERQALLHLRAGLVDDYGMLSSWGNEENTRDCCEWKRVRCSNLTGHILMLDLHGDGYEQQYLSGKIQRSLMELQQLKYLNLSWNDFKDSHIPQFFGSLSSLRYLDLSSSNFGGKIPSQLGSLSHLKYLDLKWNRLEGSIPSQLGNLSKLQYLHLGDNSFEGTIPSQLGYLSSLQKLYLGYNIGHALKIDDGNHAGGQWLSNLTSLTLLDLSGLRNLNNSHNWLQMIGKLPNLRELSLSGCSLSDHFILSPSPSKFNFSTSLAVLDLFGNTFTSSMIFQWVSNVSSSLVVLDLGGNLLKGPISNDFGTVMTSLELLHLSNNRFKVGVLKSFMNICTLRFLILSNNNLTEDLPTVLHNLSAGCVRYSLQELYLSWNQITGTLPDLSIFPSLKKLDLSFNQIIGTLPDLPTILHNLSAGCVRHSLQELDLSYNQITGTLPDLSIFPSLKKLDLSQNRLNGKILESSRLPSQLESLSIGSNSLEGGIPKSFGNTCTLSLLNLSNNSLSEELAVIIHHLSGCARYSLQELYLGENQINGTLPDLSIFPSLKGLSLSENKLNGKIPNDIRFPSQLETLGMDSNSLEGVITDSHFANMSKLKQLNLSGNSLTLTFSQKWVPSFQLYQLLLRSCKLGPAFPKWLQTQNNLRWLDISNASISDIVPEWFWVLSTKLESMDISYNNLTGTIPNLPLRFREYTSVTLTTNQFEGPVPPFLRSATSLDLSKNKFSDSLLFLCANDSVETLGQLDLSNNQLSGQIPDCWSQFKSLAYLDLSNNNLSGQVPASMGSVLELQALMLRNNSLTGEFPFSLRSCTKLVMLDAGENRLSGPIPSWIGSSLQQLQMLSLRRNHFFGILPLSVCYLTSIHLLDLSSNNLNGRIPKCFNNFTAMTQERFSVNTSDHYYTVNDTFGSPVGYHYDLIALLMWKGAEHTIENDKLLLKGIDLSSNQLSEEIPTEIGNLVGLISLNLSRNNLTGKIPSEIGRLISLEFLDLSRNQFFGSIPSSLAQIDRLTMLDVSHNHLSGKIPIGTQLQSFNASNYEENEDLCGKPLEKMCSEEEPPQAPIIKSQEDDHSLFSQTFYMGMALGFITGFWGIFGSILFNRSCRHAYFRILNNLTDTIYVRVAVSVAKFNKWING